LFLLSYERGMISDILLHHHFFGLRNHGEWFHNIVLEFCLSEANVVPHDLVVYSSSYNLGDDFLVAT
jgi:hypothetical protein